MAESRGGSRNNDEGAVCRLLEIFREAGNFFPFGCEQRNRIIPTFAPKFFYKPL